MQWTVPSNFHHSIRNLFSNFLSNFPQNCSTDDKLNVLECFQNAENLQADYLRSLRKNLNCWELCLVDSKLVRLLYLAFEYFFVHLFAHRKAFILLETKLHPYNCACCKTQNSEIFRNKLVLTKKKISRFLISILSVFSSSFPFILFTVKIFTKTYMIR